MCVCVCVCVCVRARERVCVRACVLQRLAENIFQCKLDQINADPKGNWYR